MTVIKATKRKLYTFVDYKMSLNQFLESLLLPGPYDPVVDCFPVYLPTLLVVFVLHCSHLWDKTSPNPSPALTGCSKRTNSSCFSWQLSTCTLCKLGYRLSGWVCWVSSFEHGPHLLLPVAQVAWLQRELECISSKQCIGEALRQTLAICGFKCWALH